MSNLSRSRILSKLRAGSAGQRRPFEDAPPRPPADGYLPVSPLSDASMDGLVARFKGEAEALGAKVHIASGQEDARDKILDLLRHYEVEEIMAWHFNHIPVERLHTAIRSADVEVIYPDISDPATREETIAHLGKLEVGITGADAALATTGSLVLAAGRGKGRIPMMLPPVHIAVITEAQIMPRLEDWIAYQRAHGLEDLLHSANICLVSGPSRTADIEKILVMGVHGPKDLHIIIRQSRAGRPSKS